MFVKGDDDYVFNHKIRPVQNHWPTMPFPQAQNPNEIFGDAPKATHQQIIQQSSCA